MPFLSSDSRKAANAKFQRLKMISDDLIKYYLPDAKVEYCTIMDEDDTMAEYRYHSKTIRINIHKHYNDEAEFIESILHEIAHGLCGYKHGHDDHWKQTYLSIYGNGLEIG